MKKYTLKINERFIRDLPDEAWELLEGSRIRLPSNYTGLNFSIEAIKDNEITAELTSDLLEVLRKQSIHLTSVDDSVELYVLNRNDFSQFTLETEYLGDGEYVLIPMLTAYPGYGRDFYTITNPTEFRTTHLIGAVVEIQNKDVYESILYFVEPWYVSLMKKIFSKLN